MNDVRTQDINMPILDSLQCRYIGALKELEWPMLKPRGTTLVKAAVYVPRRA